MTWSGYILLSKPALLSMADWQTVLLALAKLLGKADNDDQPSARLHWRFSNDKTQCLVQAMFDDADLDASDKTRLAKYVSQALGGKYTLTQCANALAKNVTIFEPRKGREIGAEAVRQFLAANSVAWEEQKSIMPSPAPIISVIKRSRRKEAKQGA